MICQVFLAKSGGIFIKLDLRAADNKGWRIREAIDYDEEELLLTKHQRTELFQKKCHHIKANISYIDSTNGYILIDQLL